MKQLPVRFSFLLFGFTLISAGGPLTGRWIHKNSKGEITEKIEFRDNGTFEAFITSESYNVGGKYKIEKNRFLISDTGCNANYWGKYQLSFQGKDSLTPAAMEDTCSGRKMSLDKMLFTRE